MPVQATERPLIGPAVSFLICWNCKINRCSLSCPLPVLVGKDKVYGKAIFTFNLLPVQHRGPSAYHLLKETVCLSNSGQTKLPLSVPQSWENTLARLSYSHKYRHWNVLTPTAGYVGGTSLRSFILAIFGMFKSSTCRCCSLTVKVNK